MGWEISESSLSPTYVDDPIEWWYPEDDGQPISYYPYLGQATAKVMEALDDATKWIEADGKMGPVPDGYAESQYYSAAKEALRDYGLTVEMFMFELERRVSSSWLFRVGLWDLDTLGRK